MKRRDVVIGTLVAATAGCVDRLHDVAASTPRDIDVRSRYVDGDPFVESESIVSAPAGTATKAKSFTGTPTAEAALGDDVEPAVRSFVSETTFVDDGGEAILIAAQRLAPPSVDLRLGSVSRTGRHALRIAVDEVGTPTEKDPVVHTLFVRVADDRGPPERVTVSVDGDRSAATI